MVARETPNLEVSGSSPELGFAWKHAFYSFFLFFLIYHPFFSLTKAGSLGVFSFIFASQQHMTGSMSNNHK